MKTHFLFDNEMLFIKGGGEPVRPVAPPRDVYDDEEQAQAAMLSPKEEAQLWREWLKKWLGKDK